VTPRYARTHVRTRSRFVSTALTIVNTVSTRAGPAVGRAISPARRDSIAEQDVWPLLKGSAINWQMWVLQWGRDHYVQAIRQFVETLDSQCLEKVRALNRASQSTAPDRWRSYTRFTRSRTWIC
jgi:hypothetical protein